MLIRDELWFGRGHGLDACNVSLCLDIFVY